MRCIFRMRLHTIRYSMMTVRNIFLEALIADFLFPGRATNGIVEKPAHHKPTSKKDNRGPTDGSVIPNHAGCKIKTKRIICRVTQPTYPEAKPCALTLSCLSTVAISGK